MNKAFFGLMALTSVARAVATDIPPQQGSKDLGNLSIEDLMKVEVTTASKEAQSYQNVPAAIYVVTQEMIRRAGARNIPEALRLVPGVQVAQSAPSSWQVSIRGFNSPFADKLLVLIDGRSVYNTTFSGVDWDEQEIMIEDVDRIEVIRGPGGSLWGTNAVNGIINVISKKATDTQGTLVAVQSSTISPYEASVRYGGHVGKDAFFRIYAKALKQDSFELPQEVSAGDGWQNLRIGFRGDWTNKQNSVTLTGGANSEHLSQFTTDPMLSPPYGRSYDLKFPTSDANLVGRWERISGPYKGTELQAYYSHDARKSASFGEEHDTLNADFQMPVELSSKNRITWGLGYRSTRDSFKAGSFTSVNPPGLTETLLSGFVHDDWKLSSNVSVAAGVKAEHNIYTGWEIQPSASITWNPSAKQTFWGAVSRAVRTPSVIDRSVTDGLQAVPTPNGPGTVTYIGSPNSVSEIVISNEVGWRYSASTRVSFDATAFYNQYTKLRSVVGQMPYLSGGANPGLLLPYAFASDAGATTAGFELVTRYQAARNWQLEGTYTLFSGHFYFADGISDIEGVNGAERGGITPHSQIGLRSHLSLPAKLELDSSFLYVEGTQYGVPAYTRLDVRLGWHVNSDTELSLGGQNLLSTDHREGLASFGAADSIPRSFFVKVNFKF